MRLVLLCDPFSPHSQRWIFSLAEKGAEIFVVSLQEASTLKLKGAKEIFSLAKNDSLNSADEGSVRKVKYLFNVRRVKKIIQRIQPDIVHAFYASSYGALGALVNFRPYFISVWGSDVMSFPKLGISQRYLLKFALARADKIFATSKHLSEVTKYLSKKEIIQIPFGIDLSRFKVKNNDCSISKNEFVIGAVKNLEFNYGTDYLIKIFAKLRSNNPRKKIKLMLVGGGKDRDFFIDLSKKLNTYEVIDFIGYIEHEDIPNYFMQMDLFANLSLRESFGVSVLEASASGIPVVVSNIDGLKEVYQNEITGLSIDLNSENDCVNKIQRLIDDSALRKKMGENGRRFVEDNYDWSSSVNLMWNFYLQALNYRR